MKSCSKCQEILPDTEFSTDRRAKTGLSSQCKACQLLKKKEWKAANAQKRKDYANAYRRANMMRLLEYLEDKSCEFCGEPDSVVLEFDHVDPSKKRQRISVMVCNNSWSTVLEEIKKCRILCANCHRRVTASQQDWYNYKETHEEI